WPRGRAGCRLARHPSGRGQIDIRCAVEFFLVAAREGQALLALCQRHIFLHLRERSGGFVEAGLRRTGDQRIGTHPILRDDIAVEVHRAQDILPTRIAALDGALEPGERSAPLAVCEEREAVARLGLLMALPRGLAVPGFGL